jgi:hypothetical protein
MTTEAYETPDDALQNSGPETWPDRAHLTDSRQIGWDHQAASETARAAVDALLARLEAAEDRKRARKQGDRENLRMTLGALCLELWMARRASETRWLAYSRRSEEYGAELRRYLPTYVTLTAVQTAVAFLSGQGLVETKDGSYVRTDYGFGSAGRGYRSRLRATPALEQWAISHGITTADVRRTGPTELIRLKGDPHSHGGRKPLVQYRDTEAIAGMRSRLQAWAAMMESHEVTLVSDGGPEVSQEDTEEETSLTEVGGPCQLYRVFNNGDWSLGGRFYGGWWMALKREVRSGIRIDGEPTVELDYGSLHPRICYHLAGSPLPREADAYVVPALPGCDRDLLKTTLMKLLNAGPEMNIKAPGGYGTSGPKRRPFRSVLAALEGHHDPIKAWFRSARGLELQALDAEIADRVLNYFTKRSRPVLPIHDSFIVAVRDEEMLGETMALAYAAVLGDRAPPSAWPVIRGWSTGEKEAGHYHRFSP